MVMVLYDKNVVEYGKNENECLYFLILNLLLITFKNYQYDDDQKVILFMRFYIIYISQF
jgi:hypothetical protein